MTLPRARRTSISARARGLAVRLGGDRGAGGLLGLGPGGAAEPGADGGQRLQRLDAQVGELAAAGVDPGRLEPGQQAALGDLDGLLGRVPGRLHLTGVQRAAGFAHACGRDLPVDPGVLGQDELEL